MFQNRQSLLMAFLLIVLIATFSQAADNPSTGKSLYDEISRFSLTAGKAEVSNLILKRDRVEMSFTGTFYFTSTSVGKVTGAVFVGAGQFRSGPPANDFEKNNLKRLTGVEVVETDFKQAVLWFSDDTFDVIGKNRSDGSAPETAQKLANESDQRILRETGANLASRIAISILNNENPGFFFAAFDGGKMGRFNFLMDHQNRIPTNYFRINGGEKGMIFAYQRAIYTTEVWTAFYSLDDYQTGVVSYSDKNDLVDIEKYDLTLDLQNPKSKLSIAAKIQMTIRIPDVSAVTFLLGESLSETGDTRLKKQLRVRSARSGPNKLDVTQEDWEGGFTVFLPDRLQTGAKLELELDFDGDFMMQPQSIANAHYPVSTIDWLPRHGYLDRATFDFVFLHPKNLKIVCVGVRTSEEIIKEDKEIGVTKYTMKDPVALVTFALADFQRHTGKITWENGKAPIPMEFNSMPGDYLAIKEDFILAELDNSVRYFQAIFGDYPYEKYGASFHPFRFGQGFPSMLMIPNTDNASKYTYAFISHETAHQWWGNIVAWRSYRDQWLSEGFAEYSGILYTGLRSKGNASKELLDEMRSSLRESPRTTQGVGKGRLNDVGPIILGLRLNSSKTLGAYQTLIYNKGGLVLRMLHFLLSDPATADGAPFFAMMKDFVQRHRNGVASTDDFRRVANEHFAKSPIARKYQVDNLNWFFSQWIYRSELPSYKLEYKIEDQADGSVVVKGHVIQQNAGENWFMPIPLTFTLPGNRFANGTVAAYGEKNPFSIKLPVKPTKVELDPNKWILSEKTSTSSL